MRSLLYCCNDSHLQNYEHEAALFLENKNKCVLKTLMYACAVTMCVFLLLQCYAQTVTKLSS